MQQDDVTPPRPETTGPSALPTLDFRAQGVAAMLPDGDSWAERAFCAWRKDDGGAPELDSPDQLLKALGGGNPEVEIRLPADVVLSRRIEDAPGDAAAAPASEVAARALPGLTVLPPEVLEVVATRTDGGLALRAVERSLLTDALRHARDWGFDVRAVRGPAEDPDFQGGATFFTSSRDAPLIVQHSAPPPPGPKPSRRRPFSPVALIASGGAVAALAAASLVLTESPAGPAAATAPQQEQSVAETARPAATRAPELKAEVAFSAPTPNPAPDAAEAALAAQPDPGEDAQPPAPPPAPAAETVAADAEALAVEPEDAPADVIEVAAAATAATPSLALEPPAPQKAGAAQSLAAPTPLGAVAADDAAGEPGAEMDAPEESIIPEGEPARPVAAEPPPETPSDPPDRLPGLDEMDAAQYAALSLQESPAPGAPPPAAQKQHEAPPPVPRPALRPGTTPDEPLTLAEEDSDPPISERAPETAPRPRPRPKQVAAAAAEDAPIAMTERAPEAVAPPRPRPAMIREIPARLKAAAEQAKAERAAAARGSSAPSAAEIAATATEHVEWETLDGFILIGVFDRVGDRIALMRLPNGDVRKVQRGDRIGRWTVASVDQASVSLTFEGRTRTLDLPIGD